MTMEHLVLKREKDLILKMTVVMVFIDPKTNKSKNVPEIIRKKVEEFEKRSFS